MGHLLRGQRCARISDIVDGRDADDPGSESVLVRRLCTLQLDPLARYPLDLYTACRTNYGSRGGFLLCRREREQVCVDRRSWSSFSFNLDRLRRGWSAMLHVGSRLVSATALSYNIVRAILTDGSSRFGSADACSPSSLPARTVDSDSIDPTLGPDLGLGHAWKGVGTVD